MNKNDLRPNRLLVPLCDLEAQRLFAASDNYLYRQLRIAYFMARTVVISPSFLFESPKTLSFFNKHRLLLVGDTTRISMKQDNIDDFDQEKKVDYQHPLLVPTYFGYFDSEVARDLLRPAYPLQRRDRIVDALHSRWRNDLRRFRRFSLRSELKTIVRKQHFSRLIQLLKKIPESAGNLPFTWEVVESLVISGLAELSVVESRAVCPFGKHA
jgi:hypothetical protein